MIVFADSFYWFALVNPNDAAHERAATFSREYVGALMTTEWILAEVCDGMASPRLRELVRGLRIDWRDDDQLTVVNASHDWFERGLDLYCRRPDKEWSLTDCISFVVMQEHGVTEALTGDRHFVQAGFSVLLA
jgi:predicted nucleic acid-binding protein